MGLAFYDSAFAPLTLLRTDHDGNLGGPFETLVYVRNDDAATYYTNLTVTLTDTALSSGWTAKLASGSRQPTEREWDAVQVNQSLALADVGTTGAADTSTYFPVWVRVYCPGGEPAAIRKAQTLAFSAFERQVGT